MLGANHLVLKQNELVERLREYDPNLDADMVNRAYVFAVRCHSTQVRDSGDPYFLHPIEVAGILTELKLDTHSIVTALLHDTVEDTFTTFEEIESLFGTEISQLVCGVTKLTKLELQSEATKQAENFRKLVLAMSSDIRVLLVKLADRLHNMRTLYHVSSQSKRQRIAHETLEIYTPLAERLGIHTIKDELEDLAFYHLHPDVYESITNRLKFAHLASADAIALIISDIEHIASSYGLKCSITGRSKTPYSIWRKMQQKNITLEQLSDIMAFRVIVDTVEDCYKGLGIIHSHYMVVPGRFKDYISTPKANNYQSLHTGILGPLNQKIELQIRTQEMHDICENGVAAHWQYKQGNNCHDGKQYAWLRGLLEILENAPNPTEFLEHTKLEMFQDQVFCFTPKGELTNLPNGATVVDFAYSIHSEVGNRTIGAKINGRQMPLRTILKNGDMIEIMTSKTQTPSPTWERFVITGKAKACIRRFIRNQQRTQYSDLGKTSLQKACHKYNITFNDKKLQTYLSKFNHNTIEDLYAAVGEGILSAKEVIQTSHMDHEDTRKDNHDNTFKLEKRKSQKPKSNDPSQFIDGVITGMSVSFAGCCHPLPGDKIVGIVQTGKGISIHRQECQSITSYEDLDRILDLNWSDVEHIISKYTGRIKLTFMNKPGALALVTNIISKQNADINNIKITNRSFDFWDVIVDIEISNLEQLNVLIGVLRSQSLILNADRI